MRLFNFAHIQCDRLWLQNILVSDSSDTSDEESSEPITEQDLQEMLKLHLYKKKYKKKFYSNPDVSISTYCTFYTYCKWQLLQNVFLIKIKFKTVC